MKSQAIGIFDSGVGGISIAKWIHHLLPNENLIYFADSLYAPYGEQPISVVEDRTFSIAEMLKQQGVKLIVVACNTATVNTITRLRQTLQLPIVGVEPGIKPAVEQTQTGQIGVLATKNTLNSPSFKALCNEYASNHQLYLQACPEFVTWVEQNNMSRAELNGVIDNYVSPMLNQGCDQIVLGCTHFTFLQEHISALVGDKAKLIDTGLPVAKQVHARLSHLNLLNDTNQVGSKTILTSGDKAKVTELINKLWQIPLPL